ncbi:MAG: hypothetical protein US54_C0002G0014 [Candidatus Roizmanbacteria bacterium GW2011_GWA2_37_7]|uniref:Right handed beta helix domain-containing protein n=1 Tax=Candidatus Roizmanbacteria bacterium GW2011_GWA2_37_7 TaxID=1618481 RepID=A0A0G0KE07_9BACT|nr:MAG: hypothetical protein US54_C0002G0014 [Candidatus Roizmanbacteria bacterium GW2011_GWA2_37_7]
MRYYPIYKTFEKKVQYIIHRYIKGSLFKYFILIVAIFSILYLGVRNQKNGEDTYSSKNSSFAFTGHVYANPDEFTYILEDIHDKNISTLLLGGDAENNVLDKVQEYEKKYGINIFVSPGNHEIQDDAGAKSFYEKFGNYRYIDKDGLNIIVLNSMNTDAPPYPHGGVGIAGKQLAFLKEQLEELKDKPVILVMHHAFWAPDLTEKDLQKMVPKAKLSEGINIREIQFPANDTGTNSWMKDVHPLLVRHGNVHVFAGDASLTTILEKDGVNYYTSGLRQPTKEVWVKDKLQSYLQCNQTQGSIYCNIIFFDKNTPQSTAKGNYSEFTVVLSKLITEPSIGMTMDLAGMDVPNGLSGVTYFTVEKNENACEFPGFGLLVTGEGIYEQSKGFEGIDISPSKRFYFINSQPTSADTIKNLKYYLFQNPGNLCSSYKVDFFTADFNKSLKPLRKPVDRYDINIDQKEYDKLLAAIPEDSKDRYNSNFQFPSVKARLTHKNNSYDIKIKNRGGTSHHWANDKKSYTVNFTDDFKHNDKLLFYIPDKRAYIGEYLVNKLARSIDLPALDGKIAGLNINGISHGVYYVSEDFDRYFLAKRNFTEANIYNTDPYQNPKEFTTEAISKEMILSTLKDFEGFYDRDADYFLAVIKKDVPELEKSWKYYFDPDNLSKILALYSLSGTAHYDFHNIVFYINPADGRIYFFPWDFMNYTHVGDLQRPGLKEFPNDYLNVNQLFSKLLEVPEVRNKRNNAIYKYSDALIQRLNKFEETELIGLISEFMADPTTTYYVGDGNKPSFVTYLQIPSILKSNIQYLNNKIEMTKVKGFVDSTGTILLQTDSFHGIRIKRLIVSGLIGEVFQSVKVNTIPLVSADFTVQKKTDGSQEIIFNTDVIISPKLTYKDEFATPIYLGQGLMEIDLQTIDGEPFSAISVEVENPATQETQIVPLTRNMGNTQFTSPKAAVVTTQAPFTHPLLKEVETGKFTFIDSDVHISTDLIIPKGIILEIQPGSKIKFDKNTSLISYGKVIAKGKNGDPIIFTPIDPDKPWGVVALVQEDASGIFDHTIFEYGNDATTKNRVYASGMLSGYYSDVTITNSIFRYANLRAGDDAVNIKYGKAVIQNSRFYENSYDAMDLDFVKQGSIVSGNLFEDNGNDGIDISGTVDLVIKDNLIKRSGDKGISVGEDSHISIINNFIEYTQMGVAVKDNSTVILNHNNMTNNTVGVAAYNKKELFGGGHIKVYNTLFEDNKQDFGLETISKRDWRFLDSDYLSSIEVINSQYRLTGKETKELIKESKKSVSKRDALESLLKGQLTTAKGTYATLKDTASRMKEYDSTDISKPVGVVPK